MIVEAHAQLQLFQLDEISMIAIIIFLSPGVLAISLRISPPASMLKRPKQVLTNH